MCSVDRSTILLVHSLLFRPIATHPGFNEAYFLGRSEGLDTTRIKVAARQRDNLNDYATSSPGERPMGRLLSEGKGTIC
jgi:hypothetical protein